MNIFNRNKCLEYLNIQIKNTDLPSSRFWTMLRKIPAVPCMWQQSQKQFRWTLPKFNLHNSLKTFPNTFWQLKLKFTPSMMLKKKVNVLKLSELGTISVWRLPLKLILFTQIANTHNFQSNGYFRLFLLQFGD